MENRTFTLNPDSEYIELMKLLKVEQIAQTGGHAKLIIEDGLVKCNGEIEFRKRKKLRKGDLVQIDGVEIKIL
ncbi:MAG: RNA-binding S4 domain-containing protein [Flavobacteriales bacterium]|nr:RNA-binding S4 domain-containing protein [Flavobacteriales bacterium]